MYMELAARVSLEEYLRANYEPECEFVRGEVLPRNIGLLAHSLTQRAILMALAKREMASGIFVLPSQTLKLDAANYRIADVAVFHDEPNEQIPSIPPLLCIEVLSPEDRMSRVLNKVADYIAFGVQYVWVLDPVRKKAIVYTDRDILELDHGVLRTENPAIEVPVSEIFD